MSVAALLVSASTVFALDLDEARAKGLVGERSDGYIAAISNTSDATALVASINAQRKAEYKRIASGNGQSVDVVEKLAAGKIYENAEAGTLFMNPQGQWVKK
jgi:uncharacterized protein YdbL (DUF1318 family)